MEDAFQAAEKGQNIDFMAPVGFQLCSMYAMRNDYLKMAEVAPKVLALLESTHRESESFGLINLYSALLSYYGFALAYLGDFPKGQAQCEKALRFSAEINDLGSRAFTEYWYSNVFRNKGDGKNAIEHMRNAIEYSEQAQLVTMLGMAWSNLGSAYALLGDFETALKYTEKGFKIDLDAGIPYSMPMHYKNLCHIYYELGDLDNARSCAEKAIELAQEPPQKQLEGYALIVLGSVLGKADKSKFADAEQYILQGVKLIIGLKARIDYAYGYFCLGQLYADSGRRGKSIECLEKARDVYQEMGMDYWLLRTRSALEQFD